MEQDERGDRRGEQGEKVRGLTCPARRGMYSMMARRTRHLVSWGEETMDHRQHPVAPGLGGAAEHHRAYYMIWMSDLC